MQNIDFLLDKPLWQMSGEEFCQLTRFANSCDNQKSNPDTTSEPPVYARGILELSTHLGCGQSTVYAMKKRGVLDPAIVSRIGKKIVFDVAKAKVLASEFRKSPAKSSSEEV